MCEEQPISLSAGTGYTKNVQSLHKNKLVCWFKYFMSEFNIYCSYSVRKGAWGQTVGKMKPDTGTVLQLQK